MTTYPWAIIPAILVVASGTAAIAAPPTGQVVDEFVIHQKQGDKDRLAGRLSQAIASYEKALAIRYDPTVAGRAGLALFELGNFDAAAHQLYRPINDTSTSLSKDERVKFSRAYSNALQEVCRVDITVDHADARVEIDAVERGNGRADFWVFLKPGEHAIRAQLEGFLDTVETLVTERGCRRNVTLVMQPKPVATPAPDVTTTPVEQSKTSAHDESLYAAKPPPNPLKTSANGRFVLGAGVWIPFGMTPGVGVGGQLHGGWRSKSWWEIGVEVRAAWTVGGVDFEAGSTYTWAVAAAPCGRYREHFFGCILAQVESGGLASRLSWTLPGAGVRAGYEFHVTNRFYVGLFGDLAVRFGAPTIGGNAIFYWTGNRVLPALGANFHIFLDRP